MQAALQYARHVADAAEGEEEEAAAAEGEEAAAAAEEEQEELEEEAEEDPVQQAEAEGLTLQRAHGTQSGWKHVAKVGKRFHVRYYDSETKMARKLPGSSATAEQVTLAHERLVKGAWVRRV